MSITYNNKILTHTNTEIIFSEDGLETFIQLLKRDIRDNYQVVSTIDMSNKAATSFNTWEQLVNSTFSNWATSHPNSLCFIKTIATTNAEKFTWVKLASNLSINPTGTSGKAGTFNIINNGTTIIGKAIGFNGNNNNFDNTKDNLGGNDPGEIFTDILHATTAIIGTLNISSTTGDFANPVIITNTLDAVRPASPTTASPAAGVVATIASGMSASFVTNGGIAAGKQIMGQKVHGAVFNDYAEYRHTDNIEAGRCVVEVGDGSLIESTQRLQLGANIVSDTFGFSIGRTAWANTPIAVSGRVLAYTDEPRESYKPGEAVCSGPNGTVSRMHRDEIKYWPDAIVGYVSEIPTYEKWGTDEIDVNGRIWIKI